MSAWDNLSIRDKAEMMRVAIGNGITNINDIKREYNEFAEGGSIHIKPSHRGRLTELKERTGKTEAELYNDGNPAHKKMVVFARNARKWHDLGGTLFPDGGSMNPSVGKAMQYFMNKGLTDYQAAGLVGNLMRESSMSPTARNKWSGAYGLAQWLGDRRTNLFSKYGENPTFDQQLDYIWHELNSTHKNGLKNILASKTAEEAARNAMGYYEFSAGPEGAIRAMNKYGQDGEGSMRKGIDFANSLIGYYPTAEQASVIQQPQQPDTYAYQQQILDSLNNLSNAFNTLAPAVLSYKSQVKTPQVQEIPEEPKFNPASLLTQYQMLDSVL